MKEFLQEATALVAQMTLDEKINMLQHEAPAIPRLGIKAFNWWLNNLHNSKLFTTFAPQILLTNKLLIMNHYETVFILTPVLSDTQMKEAVEKFTNILKAEGAVIVNEENWGLRKLAYPIQKKTTGFYEFIEFDAEPTVIAKLEVNFRRDERVIRFLTFKQDKYAAEYAAKRRSVKSNNEVKEN